VYISEVPGMVHVAEDGVIHPEADPMVHRAVSPWSGTHSSGEWPAYAGWGGAQADAAPYGAPLQVAGKAFGSGIGILAGSRLEVRSGGFRRFRAQVGLDDSTRNPGARVRFLVYGDGRLLARTRPLAVGEAAVPLDVDLRGAKTVELVARSEAPEAVPASVTWGEAALLR
jgi:hypothetical protein